MKSKLALLFICAALFPAARASATILPESCGNDDIKFKVNVEEPKNDDWPDTPSPAIAPPAPGMAQIVFIETLNTAGFHLTTPTTRFGVDGKWVGADKGDSHFAVDITPGEHNVCVNWQSDNEDESNHVAMDTFTAVAGKIYYYEVKVVRLYQGSSDLDFLFTLSQLSGIEGRYKAKITAPSTWKHN